LIFDSAKTDESEKKEIFQGNKFQLKLHEEWNDNTQYIIEGPATEGLQHNLTITIDQDPQLDNLEDYADWQTQSVVNQLKSCRLLLQEPILLDSGLPAQRAIFSWQPNEQFRIYQEQIYVLTEDKAFTLTASFTKKTRKTLGPQVERMMLSFKPLIESSD